MINPKLKRKLLRNPRYESLTAGSKANQENSQKMPLTPFTTHDSESPDDNLERRVTEKNVLEFLSSA
jgi:hypothetical protein